MLFEQSDQPIASGTANLRLNSPVLETRRLLLRPPHIDDAHDIASIANDYEVASMLTSMPHPYFDEDAREFIRKVESQGKGDCVYAITRKSNGEFLGICGIHEDRTRHEFPFVGYWLGRPYWGEGFATEATRAMIDLFFKVTDQDCLMISARTDNHASHRVIQKCNARYWKSGNQFNGHFGMMVRLDHYRLTRQDWFAAVAAE